MLTIRFRSRAAHLVFVTLALVGCATDQAVMARDYDNDYDGPARVGRLSYISGRVDAYTDEQSAWGPAYLNLPVTSNTGIWTGRDAKAEVTIGSTSIHIDDDSEVDFDELDDDGIEIDLENGNFVQRVRQLPRDERWYVHAGDTRIQWTGPGSYSVAYKEHAHVVTVKVFSGSARVDSRRGNYTVYSGQQLTLDEDDGSSQISNRVSSTNFEEWAERRNRAFDQSDASRYVSPEMTGAEQLGNYGQWSQDVTYGAVWFPTQVVVGWAPYRYGHWAWIAPWGWTWVDDAPWGFAPFHYGRWVQVRGRWAWCPGPRVARPAFAPALVRVQEHDNHRPTRWVPLAPKEPFQRDFFKPVPKPQQPVQRPGSEWNRNQQQTAPRRQDDQRDQHGWNDRSGQQDRNRDRDGDRNQQPNQGNTRPPVVQPVSPSRPAQTQQPVQTQPSNQPGQSSDRDRDRDRDRDHDRSNNKPISSPRRDEQPANAPAVQTPSKPTQQQAQQAPQWRQPQAAQQAGDTANSRNNNERGRERERQQLPQQQQQQTAQQPNQAGQTPWQRGKSRNQGDDQPN
ncbi:DUF6600 domain-containing protein [Aquabacterium sp.]|uniref:DUF6600 domain-containing protein n=1 Tax=Aquabacterium sp. TaxID=1872578 RepID=UPI0035B0EB42